MNHRLASAWIASRLINGKEIESITALAAKSFARVLEAEKKAGPAPVEGRYWVDSVSDALSMSPEDLSWHAIGQFEDENPGSFATIWERVKQYARDELESGYRAASVAELLDTEWGTEPRIETIADQIALGVIEKAMNGDVRAASEIADRTEGKAIPIPVPDADNGPVKVELVWVNKGLAGEGEGESGP